MSAASATAQRALKAIELENRSRDRAKWALSIRNKEGTLEEVVLGDPADRDVPENERTKLRSSPKVTLSADQLERMAPTSRRILDALVANGSVERRDIFA